MLSALHLASVDLSDRPELSAGREFSTLAWRACQGRHFQDPRFMHWAEVLGFDDFPQRKAWEFAAIMETALLGGVLAEGKTAIGFGVGTEPITAALAAHGVRVTATDLPSSGDTTSEWAASLQHAASIDQLRFPGICNDEILNELVSFVPVDMNDLPETVTADSYDFVWSSCVIEHLGTPKLGFDFVLKSAELLAPGGMMIHTTEYELTNKEITQDYGHCAVYRAADFLELAQQFRELGFAVNIDLGISLAMPEERWISSFEIPGAYESGYEEPAHLRLVIGDSISTSFAITVRRGS